MTDPQLDATSSEPTVADATNGAPHQHADTKKATPAKKVPAKKTAAKKAPANKARAKKTPAKKASPTRRAANAAAAQTIKYPRHSVEQALRIPRAIYQQNAGRPATPAEAVTYAGGTTISGPWYVEISSGKKYGFLELDGGKLVLTERARRAIAPQSDVDRVNALREAVLAAPDISDVYNHYRGEFLPANRQFLVNALTDRFSIPPDKVDDFVKIFMESMQSAELIDESGDQTRIIDAGRDEAHRPVHGKAAPKAKVSPETKCFVMQPFAAPLGTYYESIFKPAIVQAGLDPIRADGNIFGPGKIIDQIWRGIGSATVLIAELTTRNPNVFYELGLAHALQKPVILVSSNDEDVPFDLRHLRYIKYDKEDPFWGQKLIDKIADSIKLAISDPEAAIFPLNDPPN